MATNMFTRDIKRVCHVGKRQMNGLFGHILREIKMSKKNLNKEEKLIFYGVYIQVSNNIVNQFIGSVNKRR